MYALSTVIVIQLQRSRYEVKGFNFISISFLAILGSGHSGSPQMCTFLRQQGMIEKISRLLLAVGMNCFDRILNNGDNKVQKNPKRRYIILEKDNEFLILQIHNFALRCRSSGFKVYLLVCIQRQLCQRVVLIMNASNRIQM